MTEQMSNVPADGADVRTLQVQLREFVQLIKSKSSVYTEFVCIDFPKFFLFEIELVLDVPDQLLQHILQRHYAHSSAKLVDHKREMRVLAQKQFEQFLKRHHLRHGNYIAFDL